MLAQTSWYHTDPNAVHATLKRHMLADGLPIVFDPERSRAHRFVDARNGEPYIDLFSFFASQPLGYNHPRMNDPTFLEKLGRIAATKPTNSDIYTQAMADFVETFATVCVPASHNRRLFFVEGGSVAVENALKAAFDWKYRRNLQRGGPETEDLEILHFRHAFHGRTGYTLSLTNTHDPRKYQYFPKFKWPRVSPPGLTFPITNAALEDVMTREKATIAEIKEAIHARRNRIAAIIIEPIQGEGGDRHFRPEFLSELRRIADEEDMLLIFDEVQSGMGLTGTWWAWEQLGVMPDIFTFGKKAQVCGIAAADRIDLVESVFKVPSRINSTWGGNLVDMVRAEQYIRIIKEENVLSNVKRVGAHIVDRLNDLAASSGKISNVRGRGLMVAFDLSSSEERDRVKKSLFANRAIVLGCGEKSLRFRPALDFSIEAADESIEVIGRSL